MTNVLLVRIFEKGVRRAPADHMMAKPSCGRALNELPNNGPRELERRPQIVGVANGLLFKPRAVHGVSLSHLAIGAAEPIVEALQPGNPSAAAVRSFDRLSSISLWEASFAHCLLFGLQKVG
jgi:hypothetical protein